MGKAGQAVERVFAPAYLWEFRCDGAACESRCCRGWRIPVDAAARARLASLPPEDGGAIFAKLVEKEAGWETSHDENGNCAFLDADGLCCLQRNHGEAYLPDICDSYPRVSYRFSGFVERSLAPTCPVAARLALLPASPMRMEERDVPARRASSETRPPMEALRCGDRLRALQLRMMALLQDREKPLRLRFLHLGRFLSALEAQSGNRIPEDAALARCAESAAPDAEHRPRVPAYTRLRYLAELLAELYEARENYTPDRLDALAASLAAREAMMEKAIHAGHGHILENLVCNELFLHLYPFSCAGGFAANFKLFALRFRLAEFSLLLGSAGRNAPLDAGGVLWMLGSVMEKLDHNRDADAILKQRILGDFQGMDSDGFLSFL